MELRDLTEREHGWLAQHNVDSRNMAIKLDEKNRVYMFLDEEWTRLAHPIFDLWGLLITYHQRREGLA